MRNNKLLKNIKSTTIATSQLDKTLGFTLAEVLITLGIIGVVAAMTIPTLIANTRSQQYRSQIKKTLSTLNQAARMSQAQYDFDFGDFTSGGDTENCGSDNPATDKTMCALLNGTLSGGSYVGSTLSNQFAPIYLDPNISNDGLLNDGFSHGLIYQLADGAYFMFDYDANNCNIPINGGGINLYLGPTDDSLITTGCYGFIDVNGISKPNKEVRCASGSIKPDPTNPCTVDNASMGDIFPVVFHDGTVEPATNAAAYVLHTAK